MTYRITYINTTTAMFAGKRHIIVDASRQFFSGAPALDFQTLKDTTTPFGRLPGEVLGLGLDVESN